MLLRFVPVLLLVALSGCAGPGTLDVSERTPRGFLFGVRRDLPDGRWRSFAGTPSDLSCVGFPQFCRKTGD